MLPYNEDFDCPYEDKAMCEGVVDAYDNAVNEKKDTILAKNAKVNISEEILRQHLEEYKKALETGSTPFIESETRKFLALANGSNELSQALSDYQSAIISKDKNLIDIAESKIQSFLRTWKEDNSDIRRDNMQLEMLSKYAAGAYSNVVYLPPVVMETLIMPYQTDSGTLAAERILYVPVEESKWIWGKNSASANKNVGTISQ